MGKKILIFILGVLDCLFISFAFTRSYAQPYAPWGTALCAALLMLPLPLLILPDLLKGRARSAAMAALEAVIGVYLYLLIVLSLGACALYVFLFAKAGAPHPAILFPALAAVFAAAVTAGRLHAEKIKTVRFSTELPETEKPVRAVFFSDLHLGAFTTKRFLDRLSGAIAKEDPDVILFAGDLFDSDFGDLRLEKEALEMLASLPHRYGFFACPGNHDAFAEADPRYKKFLEDAGITLLCDREAVLPFFTVYGRKDSADKERVKEDALPRGGLPLLVLDHRPDAIGALLDHGADLVLCGHTHNGQTFPGNLAMKLFDRRSYGFYKKGAGCSYTTSGAGFSGFPLRLFTSNEIVVLEFFTKK